MKINMAAALCDDTLETSLNKATNVLSKEEDWEAIVLFCDKVNKDLEGPQTAVRLLIHKIQSPQERESLLGLTTLEACVKNCGRRFHQEIGKFRFINEIIKVVSPKFLGNQMSEKVKQRCVELLYSWSQVLPHEPKIKEAYQMLRRQSIVKQDPVHVNRSMEIIQPPPAQNSIFEDEDKSKVLSRLLRSKNPDDLQAANRLIKNIVKQDAARIEKISKRTQQLETVNNNIKLLNDMLHNYQPGSVTQSDKEIMKELKDNLEKERPNLFQLASLTDEHDSSAFSDILKTNDALVKVMALYNEVVNNADVVSLLIEDNDKHSYVSDLESLRSPVESIEMSFTPAAFNNSANVLDDQLLHIGTNGTQGTAEDFGDFFSVATPSFESQAPLGVTAIGTANFSDNTISLFGDATGSALPSLSDLSPLSTSDKIPSDILSSFTALPTRLSAPMITPSNLLSSDLTIWDQSVPQVCAAVPQTHPQASFSFSDTSGDLLAQRTGSQLPSVQPSNFVHPTTSSVPLVPLSAAADLFGGTDSFRSALDTCTVFGNPPAATGKPMVTSPSTSTQPALESLDALGKSLLEQSLMSVISVADWKPSQSNPPPKMSLNQMTKLSASGPQVLQTNTIGLPASVVTSSDVKPLTDLTVALETIQPGSASPQIAYDKNNLKIVLHFGKDRPRHDVQVMVVSVMSSCSSPIKNFVFQAAVPKTMRVKLQRASATDLPAYNPILPPSAITQVMLIAYPPQDDKVRLKFKLSYLLNGDNLSDIGEVQFSCLNST